MARVSAAISGRVATKRGDGLAGARVRVLDADTRQLLASSTTGEQGEFRLICLPELDRELFAPRDHVAVEVVDAQGKVIARRARVEHELGVEEPIVVEVPAARLKDFDPPAPPLARLGGSMLDPDVYATIDAAISLLVPPGEPGHNRYRAAARCPLPEIFVSDVLLDDAWRTLGGDARSARLLRRTLSFHAERGRPAGFDPTQTAATGSDSRALGFIAALFPTTPMEPIKVGFRPERRCALPDPRFLPVAAAALWAAADADDAVYLLGGLERGLCGLRTVDAIYEDAGEAIATANGRRLRSTLDFLVDECGPTDAPLPQPRPPHECPPLPDRPDWDVCQVVRVECLAELVEAFQRSMVSSSRYTITAISPVDACPGEVLTIRGMNFGTIRGRVMFETVGQSTRSVDSARWTDTEIEVVVPDDAVSGDVSLIIVDSTMEVCGRTITTFRRGDAAILVGGRPAVRRIVIGGRTPPACAAPDSDVTIHWAAFPSAGPVRVRILQGSTVLLDRSSQLGSGMLTFHAPPVTTPVRLTVEITVTTRCGSDTRTETFDVAVFPLLVIEGLEVTQGIQTFWRPGVVSNSLPTIAGKDTIVRVYVSVDLGGFNGDETPDVTGTLMVGGTVLNPINGVTPDNPSGGNPFITAQRRDRIDRTQTNDTLNFRIPAALASGLKTLVAQVRAPVVCGLTPSARQQLSWSWRTETPLRVRYVRIRDNRAAPIGTGTRPSDAQARFTVDRAFDLLPSPPTDIAPAWRPQWNTTQRFDMLGGLNGLLDDLDDEHDCDAWEWLWAWTGATECPDDDNARWICFTTPFNRGLAGRPGNTSIAAIHTVAQGQSAIPRTTPAHEISHNLGFMHVNRACGGASIGGPFYGHPNNGNLLDVPFDPFWNQAIGGSVQDYMSYGCTVWTSADSWARLQGVI